MRKALLNFRFDSAVRGLPRFEATVFEVVVTSGALLALLVVLAAGGFFEVVAFACEGGVFEVLYFVACCNGLSCDLSLSAISSVARSIMFEGFDVPWFDTEWIWL